MSYSLIYLFIGFVVMVAAMIRVENADVPPEAASLGLVLIVLAWPLVVVYWAGRGLVWIVDSVADATWGAL